MASRRKLYRDVVERLEHEGVLVSHWGIEAATDILLGLASWQLWEELVVDGTWSTEEYLRHLRTLLRRVLVEAAEA